jgi:hypothetical protein
MNPRLLSRLTGETAVDIVASTLIIPLLLGMNR